MKLISTRLKRIILIIAATVLITVIVVIAFISPITKYLVEKGSEKYTGRQIKMDWAYVNPFTGYIYFHNVKIHEFKSDSIFFSANGVSVNIALLKLLSKTYEISEFTLDHPRGIIIQNKQKFNYNDLVERFFVKRDSGTTKAPVHFNILSIKINDGEFYYRELRIPINYFIKKVNFESSGKTWNEDTIAAKFSFSSGIGSGNMEGNFTINLKSMDYRFAVVVHKFDLNIIDQYLKELTNYGSFSANLDADVKSSGNLNDAEDVTTSGLLAINNFHFGKSPGNDFASFNKLIVNITEMSPKKHIYIYDSVSLSHPYFNYEKYDYLDNIETIFGENGKNVTSVSADPAKFNLVIEIARYVQTLGRNFFNSYYKINRLAIYSADFQFHDYSLSEKFSIAADPLSIMADSIDKNHNRVQVFLKSGIKPYGNISVALSINPVDSTNFDIQYHLQKLPVTIFNPYVIAHTSFPLDRGTLELNGNWQVRNEIIKSDNHLLIIDPRLTVRIKNKDAKRLPMPLIMTFIRERSNVIDYEIPITGNLKNPKFHLHDVLLNLLENIFIKPPTTPYRMEVKDVENEIEKSHILQWQARQTILQDKQQVYIKRMTDFLTANREASIIIHPTLFTDKEKEYILFYEAKKKYFLSLNNEKTDAFSEEDSEKVDKMSIKDSLFVRYLNKQVKDTLLFTIQGKCGKLIDSSFVNNKFNQMNKERENAFVFYFKKSGVEKQVKIYPIETTIPYNGFSFYKIDYKGEIPESLSKAYEQINELNNEEPRKKLKKEREKTKNIL